MNQPASNGRPRSLLGLARLALSMHVSRRALALLAAVAALAWLAGPCAPRGEELRVATFNIENFPKSERQIEGAFEAIRALDVAAVGVQEIVEVDRFEREARRRLGATWRFAYPTDSPLHHVGVLFDGAALRLVETVVHHEGETYDGARPAFEARFVDRRDRPVALLVVHLKAGGDGFEKRRAQLRALRRVITDGMRRPGRFILLGDFNATSSDDRVEIADLTRASRARWLSRDLGCTSYWARRDGCRGQALDHVIANVGARAIRATGPCEEFGCDPGATCPPFRDAVSDHCPVLAALAPR